MNKRSKELAVMMMAAHIAASIEAKSKKRRPAEDVAKEAIDRARKLVDAIYGATS